MSPRKGGPERSGIPHMEIPKTDPLPDLETEIEAISKGFDSSTPETVAERLAAIDLILSKPETFIDKGGAASVYRLSNEAACLKLFHAHKDTERRETGIDTVKKEAAMTQFLETFSYAGVRSPKCLGYYTLLDHDGRSGIILEELDAVNLQHIIMGSIEAPDTFEKDRFMDALYQYIDALHEKKDLVHGDLFARNVMVDRQTGLPRLIDFGETQNLRLLKTDMRSKKIDEELKNLNEIDDQLHK